MRSPFGAALAFAAMVLIARGATAAPDAPDTAQAAPDPGVRAVLVPGAPSFGTAPSPPQASLVRRGDLSLNFPSADIAVVAKAVLGDMLGLQYSMAPDLHTPVTVVTQRPIARADVLKLFEAALVSADLAMVLRNGVYVILPLQQARLQAPLGGGGDVGFATESITLNFVNAEALKQLIDPILPNVVVRADPSRNGLVVAGTAGQRRAAHDLVRQFDVDWLRNTSFALFVPQRTDSRLIVPELDRMINANGSPTRGLVKLIAMDRLNGILAISTQGQYLEDVRRWIDILDREGENNERRIFVYRVQNGRSADLAKVLANAFGARSSASPAESRNARPGSSVSRDDLTLRPNADPGVQQGDTAPVAAALTGPSPGAEGNGQGPTVNMPARVAGAGAGIDIATDDLHAKISSDETNNAIVVYATPRDYAVIEEALRKLDIPPSQVMIEAAIVEVTLTDNLSYGVQWQFANSKSSAALSQGTSAAPVQTFPGFSYFYSNAGIAATLNALETLTKIKVISSPKLLVLNNQTASLQVGDQVPIVTGSAIATVGSNSPIVNSIEYRDTGIILKITPRVNSSGLVLLDMAQEVSQVEPNLTTPGVTSPTISTRRVSTSVAVQDGEVLALGGLISSSITTTKTGIPYISRIPVVGALFGNHQTVGDRTELIVLLQPRVVRAVDDGRALTDELKDKLKTLRPLLTDPPVP
jgi:general secretion pathway protein D